MAITGVKLAAPLVGRLDLLTMSYLGLTAGFAVIGWAATWAILTSARPAMWIVPVLLLAAGIGAAETWLIHRQFTAGVLAHFGAMMLSEAIFLLVSLGAVRWAGYRWGEERPRVGLLARV